MGLKDGTDVSKILGRAGFIKHPYLFLESSIDAPRLTSPLWYANSTCLVSLLGSFPQLSE